jgi:hypothetical protein
MKLMQFERIKLKLGWTKYGFYNLLDLILHI